MAPEENLGPLYREVQVAGPWTRSCNLKGLPENLDRGRVREAVSGP